MKRAIACVLTLSLACWNLPDDPNLLANLRSELTNWLVSAAYADEASSPVVVTSPKYSDFVWATRQSSLGTAAVSATPATKAAMRIVVFRIIIVPFQERVPVFVGPIAARKQFSFLACRFSRTPCM